MSSERNRGRALGSALVVWGTFFDQMALLPVAGQAARALGASHLLAGFITSAPGIGSLVGNGLGGLLVDRVGPRKAMQIALIGAVLSALGYLLPFGPMGFLLVQLIHGGMTAMLNPAVFAVLADRDGSRGNRAERLARSGIAIAIASLAAPPLSVPLVARYGVAALAPVLILVIGVTGWLGYRLLGPALDEYRPSPSPRPISQLPWGALVVPYLAAFALLFGQGLLAYSLPIKAADLGLRPSVTGSLFSAFAAAALLCFATPLARIGDRFNRLGVVMGGLLLAGFGLLTMSMAGGAGGLYQGMTVYGFGFGLLFPTMGALVVDAAPADLLGRAFGIFYVMFSLGGDLGPPIAGYLHQYSPLLVATGPILIAGVTALGFWALGNGKRPPVNETY